MTRQTIDYGIDLGTTNSEIAFIDPGAPPCVVENNYNERITPSAVAYSKKGQLQVGKTAYNVFAGRWEDVANVHIQFKRRMGTDDTFLFPYTGKKYRADQLSAEILKELRLSVERKRGEQIDAAIVTIPAAFEQPQIAATKKAAEQAGFLTCELLQEPVAASLAYGIRDSGAKGYWLVYDLGGGTFDAALLQLKDGLIRVVNHCGDNYLGGKDIDNAILDRIVLPRIAEEYGLDDFNRGEERWKYAIARILYFAEIAKIELSKSKTAELRNIDRIWDPIEETEVDLRDFEFELTRESVAPLYQTIFQKSANYVKDLLSQSKINPSAIEKIILVGGPTQFPLIREGLAAEFKAPLDFSRDVMTVVAEGAAVFASTRRITRAKPHKAAPDSVLIEFDYEPSGADSEPNIGGSVKLEQGRDSELFTIELVNIKSQWRSGKVKLSKNGAFIIPALADKGLNEYRVELCDQNGTLLATNPPSLTYNLTGIEVQAQTLIHNISLSQPDGKPFKILSKGQTLPAKGTVNCRTDHLIKRGSDDALIIQLFEGNNLRFASRNTPIGHLCVEAKDMPRDLPAGQEVELKLRLDGEGNIQGTAEVLVFNMDELYQITWSTHNIYEKLQTSQLSQMSELALERLAKLRSSSTHDSLASEVFLRIEAEDMLAQIEETLQAAQVDRDQASKCHKLLLRLNELLDEIEDRNERPELEKKAQRAMEYAKNLVENEKSADLAQIKQSLCNEIQASMKDPDFYALVQAVDRMDNFIRSILAKNPEWWVRGFQYAEENRHLMTDSKKADRLFAQGRKAIDEQDLDSLRAAVGQLMLLLPLEIQTKAEEFGNVWGTRVN